jgi:hypothetical protein
MSFPFCGCLPEAHRCTTDQIILAIQKIEGKKVFQLLSKWKWRLKQERIQAEIRVE